MASFEMEGMDDFMNGLSQIDIDRIAPKMLEEAAPILEEKVKKRAAEHKDTGSMIASIKPTKPANKDNAYRITVRPTGKDKKGVRNMDKMAYLEFGTNKQAATPVLSPAVREAEAPAAEKMQEVFDREVEHIDNL